MHIHECVLEVFTHVVVSGSHNFSIKVERQDFLVQGPRRCLHWFRVHVCLHARVAGCYKVNAEDVSRNIQVLA